MDISLRDKTRNANNQPGDTAVLEIQQLGEDKTKTDTTNVIVDTDPEERDIRISDGDTVVKIRLGKDYTIWDVMQDDIVISEE